MVGICNVYNMICCLWTDINNFLHLLHELKCINAATLIIFLVNCCDLAVGPLLSYVSKQPKLIVFEGFLWMPSGSSAFYIPSIPSHPHTVWLLFSSHMSVQSQPVSSMQFVMYSNPVISLQLVYGVPLT